MVKLVFVKRCNTCNEILPKDAFNKHQECLLGVANQCRVCRSIERRNTHYEKKTEGTKTCPKCDVEQPYDEYYADHTNKDGCQTYCITCQLENQYEYVNTFKGFTKTLYRDLKRNAKDRGIEVSIKYEDIVELFKNNMGYVLCLEFP